MLKLFAMAKKNDISYVYTSVILIELNRVCWLVFYNRSAEFRGKEHIYFLSIELNHDVVFDHHASFEKNSDYNTKQP